MPPAVIDATLSGDTLQIAVAVRSDVEPSLYVPVAVNCRFCPAATEAVEGDTDTDTSADGVTVNVADPLMPCALAVMVATPSAKAVAAPPGAIDATPDGEAIQFAFAVRSAVEPSLYVPVAVNCWFWLAATEAVEGDTAIDSSTGAVTVNVAVPLMP
jgi:hypothetical protein